MHPPPAAVRDSILNARPAAAPMARSMSGQTFMKQGESRKSEGESCCFAPGRPLTRAERCSGERLAGLGDRCLHPHRGGAAEMGAALERALERQHLGDVL